MFSAVNSLVSEAKLGNTFQTSSQNPKVNVQLRVDIVVHIAVLLWLKGGHVRRSKAMALKVVLQSRLGWPFEITTTSDSTFATILEAYAASQQWHPSVFNVYVGDQLVLPETKLSQCTSGTCGMLLCSVSTPEDNSAHRVWERLRQKASELKGEVTKDAFFKRHGLFEHT